MEQPVLTLDELKSNLDRFSTYYNSQTNKGTYRTTGRNSLLNEGLGTRANSIWKMAEYIVATYESSDSPLEKYIEGWTTLTRNFKNQYLFLEVQPKHWNLYDWAGTLLNEEMTLEDFFSLKEEEYKKELDSGEDKIVLNEIIINPLKDSYSTEELANELKLFNEKLGTSGIHLFGLKYGKYLESANLKMICTLAGLSENYHAELNKMRNLYSAIKSKKFGVSFYEDINLKIRTKKCGLEGHSQHIYNYLRALRTKPFLLLAGISGTGKSRIVRKLAQATITEELQKKYDKNFKSEDFSKDRWDLHRPANFELIQVKPNWHNSMDVVGYLSNIPSPHYVFTPFINFIVKAWQNPAVPFFLCLDEMNLAPVEEYFAEFLSAIESRDIQNGQYVTDPIIKPFREYGKIENDKGTSVDVTANMLKTLFPHIDITDIEDVNLRSLVSNLKNKGLTLPPNLIVIGTVNMDETTFSFSRKVLDRAMSIEMNEVNYDAFLSGDTDEGLKELVENRDDINELLVDRPIQAKEVLDAIGDDKNAVLGYLKRINTLLEGTPFKLGYRVANEAMLYLNASYDFGNNDWREAMDQFTLMKILSRIEGDTNKLRIGNSEADQKKLKDSGVRKEEAEKFGPLTLLTAMRIIIEDELKEVRIESSETEAPIDEDGSIVDTSEIAPPKPEAREVESIKKLDSMISQLERERFVSYWN